MDNSVHDQQTELQQTQAGDSLAEENSNVSKDAPTVDSPDDERPSSSQAEEYSEEFNSEEWMDLLDNKEILRKVLFAKESNPEAKGWPRANRGSKVRINLETKVYSTQQVISSECFQNLEVIVGEYEVIHGIDLILPMMYLNEKSRVLINPRFGYGSKGKLPDVKPNCRLDCTVEILEIQDDLDSCSPEEKVALGEFANSGICHFNLFLLNDLFDSLISSFIYIAERRKVRGNFWFSREEYQTAISCYRKCVEISQEEINDVELAEKVNRVLIDCYNNLSITQFKIDSLNAALESADHALSLDAKNVKALYRKAQVLEKRNDLEEAVELMKCAIELEPNNTSVANLLTNLRKRRLIELENEKKLCQKMISPNSKKGPIHDETSHHGTHSQNQLVSKKFKYTIIGFSAIVAVVLAFLINNYLTSYA